MTHVTPDARPAEPVAFSTVGLPEDQRLDLWETHNADALIGLRCRTLSGSSLEATEINVQLEHVHLARVTGTSHVVERDAALIRDRPAESVAMFFSLKGEAFFYHDDGVHAVRPGQLLLYDADRPFVRGFARGLEELVLKVPRDVFTEATGIHDVSKPVVLGFASGTNSFAHALARQVGGAVRGESPRAVDEQTLLQLVAALVGRDGDQNLSAAHRAAAQAYVEEHLSDPSLSAVRIAAAVGISSRHLSRVFAQVGTSVPRYVLLRRLEAARRLLEKPAATSMTIAEVAHHCGFSSAAHFSNAFTSHFGERASEVRRMAAVARAVPLD
jgi:AraC-like DNA-binding protein